MRPKICVRPEAELSARRRLFAALSDWLEVDFCADEADAAGHISFVEAASEIVPLLRGSTAPTYVFVGTDEAKKFPQRVTWSDTARVPMPLRGQKFSHRSSAALDPSLHGEVLASSEAGPIWIHCEKAGHEIEFASNVPEEIPSGSYFYDHLKIEHWPQWLPLIHFIRRVAAGSSWSLPPLRALIMFDDPNLHWQTYGSIDYLSLRQHAKQHNYHAAMATIPFDTWRASSKAVELFRKNSAQLSLLVHGNNHTRCELAQPYLQEAREQLVAQSLKRVSRLEQRHGLAIPRIMAAPHNACSEAMATELLRQGFEAACISWRSLRNYNPQKCWAASFGLQPAEFLGNGFPIIPRFPLSGSCLPEIILAAFLGQPIIPVGHHEQVTAGLDLLAEVSGAINRLGQVEWCSMGEIARTNMKTRVSGDTLEIGMFARSLRVDLTPDVRSLKIRRAWSLSVENGERLHVLFDGDHWLRLEEDEITVPWNITRPATIEIRATCDKPVDYRSILSPPFRVWPAARRLLAEARDRVQPLMRQKKNTPRTISGLDTELVER